MDSPCSLRFSKGRRLVLVNRRPDQRRLLRSSHVIRVLISRQHSIHAAITQAISMRRQQQRPTYEQVVIDKAGQASRTLEDGISGPVPPSMLDLTTDINPWTLLGAFRPCILGPLATDILGQVSLNSVDRCGHQSAQVD